MEGNRYPNIDSMIRGMNAFNSATAEIARRHGLPLIDLESQIPKTTDYFLDDVHYTEDGNARIADLISAYLIQHELLIKAR
jgi:lysophospholipase L1-like esterase